MIVAEWLPVPILEAIKWVVVISCFGFWVKHLLNYAFSDEKEKGVFGKIMDKIRGE